MFDVAVTEMVSDQCDQAARNSTVVTLASMDSRSIPVRLSHWRNHFFLVLLKVLNKR